MYYQCFNIYIQGLLITKAWYKYHNRTEFRSPNYTERRDEGTVPLEKTTGHFDMGPLTQLQELPNFLEIFA